MAKADPASYEAMISALESFASDAGEQCETMAAAGQDCVDNTEDDPAANKANAKLQKCISDIRTQLETIKEIQSALKEELDDIIAAAAKANFDE